MRQQKIVIGFDGSSTAEAALAWALDEARRTGASAELVYADEWPIWQPAASLAPSPALRSDSYVDEVIGGMLDRAVRTAHRTHPGVPVTATTVRALASTALAERSERAGMIVLGTRGHAALGGLLGSVGAAVGAHAHCPVVVIHGAVADTGPVIAGIDGSPLTPAVLRFAAEQAAGHRATLRIMRIRPAAGDLDRVAALASALAAEFPAVEMTFDVGADHPVDALVTAGESARLLVIGSRGHGSVRGLLLGAATRNVLRHAACPVAIVHALDETGAPSLDATGAPS